MVRGMCLYTYGLCSYCSLIVLALRIWMADASVEMTYMTPVEARSVDVSVHQVCKQLSTRYSSTSSPEVCLVLANLCRPDLLAASPVAADL